MACAVLEVSRCCGRRGVCEGVQLTLLLPGGQSGYSALHRAAQSNAAEAVKALCDAGAEKDLQDKVSLLLPPSLPPPPSLPKP